MTKKRRDKKGTVLRKGETYRTDGRYVYRYKDLAGKTRSCYARSLAELRKIEQIVSRDMQDGIDYGKGEDSVISLVERYIAQKRGVREGTKEGYNFVLNLLKKQEFSARKIKDIKPSDAKLFLIQLHEEGGYSYSTLTEIRRVLKPAFEMAVEDSIIRRNPFLFPVSSIAKNDGASKVALTRAQRQTYLSYLLEGKTSRKYYDEVVILLETGMRVSEMYGLTISDIDLTAKRVRIERQLLKNRAGRYYIEPPKTKNGVRVVPLSNAACEAFRHAIQNRKHPKREVIVDGCGNFLFLDMNGRPKVALHLQHALKRILDKYNESHAEQLPRITPHTFRHTFITDMYHRGIDIKSLQDLVGHGDVQTTLSIYTHSHYERVEAEFFRLLSNENTPASTGD